MSKSQIRGVQQGRGKYYPSTPSNKEWQTISRQVFLLVDAPYLCNEICCVSLEMTITTFALERSSQFFGRSTVDVQ